METNIYYKSAAAARYWLYLRRYYTDFKTFGCFEKFGTFSKSSADQIHATRDFWVCQSGKTIVAVTGCQVVPHLILVILSYDFLMIL